MFSQLTTNKQVIFALSLRGNTVYALWYKLLECVFLPTYHLLTSNKAFIK
jgi:hypothetical protein